MSSVNRFGPLNLILPLALAMVLTAAPSTLTQERTKKTDATVNGKIAGTNAKAEIVVRTKQCSCKDCTKPLKCDCCPDQITVSSNDNGEFRFTVPPGKYTLEIKGKESSKKEIELVAGEKKDVTIEKKM